MARLRIAWSVGRLIACLLLLALIACFGGAARAEPGYAVGINPSTRLGEAPLAVSFGITIFTERGGRIASATFDPGDGGGIVQIVRNGAVRPSVAHTYSGPGRYAATVTIVTAAGEKITSSADISVRARQPADPAELLRVTNAEGDAPHTATFDIGGASLPFQPTGARLDLGDGRVVTVVPGQTLSHTYQAAGRYTARLLIAGKFGNSARAQAIVTANPPPRLKFTVAPTAGVAPLEVTVLADIPTGKIAEAGVFLDGAPFMEKPGERRIRFDAKGEHVFELRAVTSTGERYQRSERVIVKEENLSGYYDHAGGVVEITQSGGAFSGVMRAPSPAQAKAGYGIGMEMVRGAIADVAYSFRAPTNPDDPDSPVHRYYADQAEQLTEGEYLYLYPPECSPREQWSDYTFRIDYGGDGRPASIAGVVVYDPNTTVADQFFARRGMVRPLPGLVGNVQNVADQIAAMLSAAGITDDPDKCIPDTDNPNSMPADFRRIDEAEARVMALSNAEGVRAFARAGYDQLDPEPAGAANPTRASDPAPGAVLASQDPVLLHSGEFFETARDLGSLGEGFGWIFQRTYRSQSDVHTSLGHGWMHNFQLALVQAGKNWRFRGETGATVMFEPKGGSLFVGAGGARLLVTDAARRLRLADGTIYDFVPSPGRPETSTLMAIVHPSGRALRLSYDLLGRLTSVTDPDGRIASYGYDAAGYLDRVTAPDGQRLLFKHDDAGNLTEIAKAAGSGQPVIVNRYDYSDASADAPALAHNLTAVHDGKGNVLTALTYGEDASGEAYDRVVAQRTGDLEELFSYRTVADPAGPFFETTLTATGRAVETHRFDAQGVHVQTDYAAADGTVLTATSVVGPDGSVAGHLGPTGRGMLTLRQVGEEVVELRPDASSADKPILFLIEREPLFGKVKRVSGPFEATVPADAAARASAMLVENAYDYEEAGLAANDPLRAFGLAWDGKPLGDVNGDGVVGDARGLTVASTVPGTDSSRLTTLYRWTDAGDPLEVIAPDGSRRGFSYAKGRLESVEQIAADGGTPGRTTYQWDEDGNLLSAFDDAGPSVAIAYDDASRPASVFTQDGVGRGLAYDDAGRVVGERELTHSGADPPLVAAYTYDPAGRMVSRSRFAGDGSESRDTYVYDAFGRAVGATTPTGTWSRSYDPFGRVAAETFADGTQRSYSYNAAGDLIAESGDGWRKTYSYDGHGRLVGETDQGGTQFTYAYDAMGQIVAAEAFDAAGKPLLVTRTDYDRAGGVAALEMDGGPGNTPMRQGVSRDPLGKPVKIEVSGFAFDVGSAPDGTPISLIAGEDILPLPPTRLLPEPSGARYDGLGRLVALARPDGADWTFSWDQASRPLAASRNGVALETATYASDGTTKRDLFGLSSYTTVKRPGGYVSTDRSGNAVAVALDTYGRLTGLTSAGGAPLAVAFRRDGLGRIIRAERDGVVWTRRFDGPLATADSLAFPDGDSLTLARTHDRHGRLATLTYPSGLVAEFTYPSFMTTTVTVAGQTFDVTYGPGGEVSGIASGPLAIDYAWPMPGAPTTRYAVTAKNAGKVILDREWTVENGVVTSIAAPSLGLTGSVSRDDAGRIVSAGYIWPQESEAPRLESATITYGPGGTPFEVGRAGNVIALTIAESGKPLSAGPEVSSADEDGRLIAHGGRKLTLDAMGAIVGVASKRGVSTYRRDALGAVVEIAGPYGSARIIRDGSRIVEVAYESQPSVDFVYEPRGALIAVVIDGRAYAAVTSYDGSPIALVDSEGKVAPQYYTPFGEPAVYSIGPLFAGMLYDPAQGIYLTPTRALDPTTGIFLSPEPLGATASPYPYLYAHGDPLTFRDPSGTQVSPTGVSGEDIGAFERATAPWRDSYDSASEKVDDVGAQMNAEGSPVGRTGTDTQGPSAATGDAAGDDPEFSYGINKPDPIEEAERAARRADEDARLADLRARNAAAHAAFKRNNRYAESRLHSSVVNAWLQRPNSNVTWYSSTFDPLPPLRPGPVGSSAGRTGDPHGLLVSVLGGRFSEVYSSTGSKIRAVFADLLNAPPAVAAPVEVPAVATAPGRANVAAPPAPAPPSPSPPGGGRPPRPSGMAGLGGQ